MFILNLTKEDLIYRAHGETITLKQGVNILKDCLTTEKELKDHFGDLITVIDDKVDKKKVETPVEENSNTADDNTTKDNTAEGNKESDPVEEKSTKPNKKQLKRNNKK